MACPNREPYIPTEWFSHVWFLRSLQQAGYPFQQDDLSIEEWLALGELKIEMEAYRPDGQ